MRVGFGQTGLSKKENSIFQEGSSSSKILLAYPDAQGDGRGRTTDFLGVRAVERESGSQGLASLAE